MPNPRPSLLTLDQLLERTNEPAHVIGTASAEGVAVARFLVGLGFSRVTMHDLRPSDELRRAFRTNHGAYSRDEQDEIWDEIAPLLDRGRFGDDYLRGVSEADTGCIVLGQGWYLDAANRAAVRDAVPAGALVTSMSELYFACAPGPIAGVTGTNGKSTTVALADHLLRAGGVTHLTAGNERSSRQFLPDIRGVAAGTLTLLEVSNRQLLQLPASPQVAAITSLTPDHLQEHGSSFAGYVAAKRRLFAHQGPEDIAIINADSEACLLAADAGHGRRVLCGLSALPAPSVCWVDGELIAAGVPVLGSGLLPGPLRLAGGDDLLLPGQHNQRNAAIAVALALACGVHPDSIAPALRAFGGKSLRLELIAAIDEVEVYSDIKSTTPEATLAAIDALGADARRLLLIVGGDDKGLDYAGLAQAVVAQDIPTFAVPGSASDQLDAGVQARGGLLRRVDTLAEALDAALQVAAAGDRVIVSPAAAGFWSSQLQGKTSLRVLVRRRERTQQEADDT